jgi:hypothetical protein
VFNIDSRQPINKQEKFLVVRKSDSGIQKDRVMIHGHVILKSEPSELQVISNKIWEATI